MQYCFLVTILKNYRFYREKESSRQSNSTDSSVGRVKECSARSEFDSSPYVAGSYSARWMHYCFLLTILKKNNGSSPYKHVHKTDSTDSSFGRAEKFHLRTSMFIRQIPLIAHLVERRTVV